MQLGHLKLNLPFVNSKSLEHLTFKGNADVKQQQMGNEPINIKGNLLSPQIGGSCSSTGNRLDCSA